MRATTPCVRRTPARRPGATVLAALVLFAGVQVTGAAGARADEVPSTPPGTESTVPPPEVDGNSPGLKMRDGATLAAAKVLPLISIVESEGGEERREETSSNLKFALQAEVLFGKDSARLTPSANARIAAIAEEIKKQSAAKVRIFGFTDNLGSSAHGDVLSKQRADAVHKVLSPLLTAAGITYEIRGYGEQYPIADNSTEEGRKKNRRVEVSFPRGGGGGGSQG
ncbi:OmpA family protein [Streptomyces sp. SP18CS02]|uniref:OmpA family protein n=1 Tax=Streptomyces sp. SP18CS02 TaxID=3002531 RepID=UPI002E77045A|nr:OmpA family protein [Streptomyces sp. SP18CS02]MEE1756295.1 OmpA family protein [Streptomyces sp. SP18CS02]